MPDNLPEGVWFVYDGQCPLCLMGARHLRVRESAGPLHLLDAREAGDHPLMTEIRERGYDLDRGMVVKVGPVFYHGRDALHVMALIGTEHGWFNRVNARLFRCRIVAHACYPAFRALRGLLLRMRGIGALRNLET